MLTWAYIYGGLAMLLLAVLAIVLVVLDWCHTRERFRQREEEHQIMMSRPGPWDKV